MKKIIYVIIAILLLLIIIYFAFFFRPTVTDTSYTMESCGKIEEIYSLLINDRRLMDYTVKLNEENKDEYWWIDFLLSPDADPFDTYETHNIKKNFYAAYDSHKDIFPSSYIANPKMKGVNFLRYGNNTKEKLILLMERESFYDNRYRYVVFIDGTWKYMTEDEIAEYKDW